MLYRIFNFKNIYLINFNLFATILLIIITSLLNLYSVSSGDLNLWIGRQIIFDVLFFALMIGITVCRYAILKKCLYWVYLLSLILLVYVDISGHRSMGATRWIRFLGISFQPSELAKLGIITCLAFFLGEKENSYIHRMKNLITPATLILLPSAFVLVQPDLGTAILIIAIGTGILFLLGVEWWKFVLCFVIFISITPFVWHKLHNYQKKRIEIFLNPQSDPLGYGYNIMQTKFAIGSAGMYGKGYMQGRQVQLSYLPEKQTDFVFVSFVEDMGFIGGTLLILTYLYLILSIFFIATRTINTYNLIILYGIGCFFFFSVFINIGMVLNVFPIVGIPLPLMSYGGTSTLVSLIMLGIVLNIDIYNKI